jgi:hypothetical protein
MNETMSRYLQLVNMPSRQEVLALGERLSGIDERLSRMEALLAGRAVGPDSSTAAAPGANRPPRTKKPPAAKS